MKINPCTYAFGKTDNHIHSSKKTSTIAKTTKIIGYTLGAAALGGAIYYAITHNNKNIAKSVLNTFKEQIQSFPADIEYRKSILQSMGMGETNFARLRSIVGPQEYKSIIHAFSDSSIHYTPGTNLLTETKDGYKLKGVLDKTFRASMHNHTTHSDGRMSVQELLDQSAQYADEVFESLKNKPNAKAKHAPFTIAITDHDTVEGCKEAVKIISQNPEKYKNLRVVLGMEMSVENRLLKDKIHKPVHLHFTINGINPFDKNLNKFLDSKKMARTELMKNLLQKASFKRKQFLPKSKEIFNFEEAEKLYPVLKHKILHVNVSLKNYLQYKTLFTECFENNKLLQKELDKLGIDTSKVTYDSFLNKYIDSKKIIYAEKGYERYYDALKKYVADLLIITPKEAEQKLTIPNNIKRLVDELGKIAINAQPRMNLQPAYVDIEEMLTMVKNQKDGYITWAHPACTDIGGYLRNRDYSHQAMTELFNMFKEKGGDKALAVEIHYPYFGELGKSDEWLNLMHKNTTTNKLYCSGGLDSHGKNIFYSDI